MPNIVPLPAPKEDWPRMVTLYRGSKEVTAVLAEDATDAAMKAAVLALQQKEGLQIGDVIQVMRV